MEDPTPSQQHQAVPKVKETSFKEMLHNLMTDEEFMDAALQGTDGVSVKINRYALAARSAVFRQMLFGKFVESTDPVVKIGFRSRVLKAVVEYVHTDSAEILLASDSSSSRVETLVSMTAAGAYFQLPGLSEKSHKCLSDLLEKKPALSFAVLEGCKQTGPSVPQELEGLALSKIRSLVQTNIPQSEIYILSPELVEEIMKDPEMETYELELFKLLQAWAEAVESPNVGSERNPPEMDSRVLNRRELAAKMTTHLQLEHIDPLSLSTIVASSGLVTSEQLLGAYTLQALKAQEIHNIAFNRHRKMPEWESVSDTFRKCLKCPPIRAGTHRWTLEVEEHGRYLWLGIVHQKSGALYAFSSWSDGVRLYVDESYGPPLTDFRGLKLATGSKVNFVLNMTPSDPENGTLSASVNGGPSLKLFANLLDRGVSNEDNSGFVPAMCLKDPAKVRLLSMEKV